MDAGRSQAVRCFIRLPADKRAKIVLLPADGSFDTFKTMCVAKLGLEPGKRIMLLLGSNTAADVKVDCDSLPEIEAIDEISPEDTVIVLPAEGASYGNRSRGGKEAAQNEDEEDREVEEEDEEDEEDDEDDEEEEAGKDGGDEVELVSERTRQSVLDGSLSRAKQEGRFIEIDEEDDSESDDNDKEWIAPAARSGGSKARDHRTGAGGTGNGHGGGDSSSHNGSGSSKRPRTSTSKKSSSQAAKPTIEAILDGDTENVGARSSSGGARGQTAAGASMKSASDSATGAAGDNELEKIKVRIRKMLSRGLHAGTPEEEAASSMRLAEKLLAKHNLAQADVLQEDHVPEALRGGKTAVHLRSVKDQTPCQTKQWMHTLAHACTKNFECSYYFSSHPTRTVGRLHYPGVCDFTFYGIATNASLAAFAFAAAFNRIACLAALHVVPAQEYEVKRRRGEVVCSKGAYTTAARESYKDGLARGLYDSVREDKARKELEQQRRLELARSKASRGEAWQSSDDDDDDDGGDDCIRDDGGGGAPAGGNHASSRGDEEASEGEAVHSETADINETKPELKLGGGDDAARAQDSSVEQKPQLTKSAADAVAKYEKEAANKSALVAHTESVAASFLKEAGVKLSNRKHTYTKSTWRKESYEKGKIDSKEIDINQRSLKGAGEGEPGKS